MTTAKLRNLLAEEARRLIMFDIKDGCGECHWASALAVQWAKELTRRRNAKVQPEIKRETK